MSQSVRANGHENLAAVSGNVQLASPALSPINEYTTAERAFLETVKGETTAEDNDQELRYEDELHHRGRRRSSDTRALRMSPRHIRDLTTSPDSLPLRRVDDGPTEGPEYSAYEASTEVDWNGAHEPENDMDRILQESAHANGSPLNSVHASTSARAPTMPVAQRKHSGSKSSKLKPQLTPINIEDATSGRPSAAMKPSPMSGRQASPMPSVLPIPPLSLPTYLHLELSSSRPSALYIHRSATTEFPYESSKMKFERLQNFLLLPPNLEQVLWFGAIACLDAWLYTFTILPLRFIKALAIVVRWLGRNAAQEVLDVATFVHGGLGRLWERRKQDALPGSRRPSVSVSQSEGEQSRHYSEEQSALPTPKVNGQTMSTPSVRKSRKTSSSFRHRRTRSTPSVLLPNHKADLLQGLLIICSCTILMWFDASRMYHSIRGQAAIKLYVIYNVLEVFDRLFAALGQDVLECLFSKETLERNSDGRSKVLRPLWMFVLALIYNVVHSTALFYQVITLNVAVNSYSNALLTLLMSNQFVEIKGTVFKRFEKEGLFQLTCADVVERFQLWLMLLIIALRNVVEVGGLSISINTALSGSISSSSSSQSAANSLGPNSNAIPLTSGFVIPKAFTLLPAWTGEVLGPFMIVLGSEALVDWCKHAYITKFNNTKPAVYGRFLDVLAKDYYSHAFADQNLTKRLGLPVLPLSCLFIRACMQTYHMFLATHMPVPIPAAAGAATAGTAVAATLAAANASSAGASPTAPTASTTTAALQHIDHIFRRALGRSSFGAGVAGPGDAMGGGPGAVGFSWWSVDDLIAGATMAIFFLALYLVLLAIKLVLGMSLLSYARRRYRGMKERERQSVDTQGQRVGGWGMVEVSEDKRRWIYEDDPEGLSQLRERENRRLAKAEKSEMKLENVNRYSMVAKVIW